MAWAYLHMDLFSINACLLFTCGWGVHGFRGPTVCIVLPHITQGLEHPQSVVPGGSWSRFPTGTNGWVSFGGVKVICRFSTVRGLVPLNPELSKGLL